MSTLTAAFNLFKKPATDSLSDVEVRTMLDYLGFPKEEEDVDKIMKAVDVDGAPGPVSGPLKAEMPKAKQRSNRDRNSFL